MPPGYAHLRHHLVIMPTSDATLFKFTSTSHTRQAGPWASWEELWRSVPLQRKAGPQVMHQTNTGICKLCLSVWDPSNTKLIKHLKSVQWNWKAVWQARQRYCRTASVNDTLMMLDWLPLQHRRDKARITNFYLYKLHHGSVAIDTGQGKSSLLSQCQKSPSFPLILSHTQCPPAILTTGNSPLFSPTQSRTGKTSGCCTHPWVWDKVSQNHYPQNQSMPWPTSK